jgi:hypothetical protein
MSSKLDREAVEVKSLIITNSISTTQEIDFSNYSMMVLDFPDTWTTSTLTIYSRSSVDGTYRPLRNASGAVTMTATQGTSYTATESIAPAMFLKFVSNEAGNNAIVCGAILKS